MNLKDVIKLSAVYLGRENVLKYLDGNLGSSHDVVMSQVDTLTRCANVVISELASTFIPLIKREKVVAINGKLYYSAFSETPLEILGMYDGEEQEEYKILPEYIEVKKTILTVEYKYLPPNYGLTDEIGYSEQELPLRILAYGTTAEFCLTEKSFDESVMWRKRFSDAIAMMFAPKNRKIKQRSFI